MKNEQTRTSELHKLRTLHLFAGAGGGILADILLGHHPVCAVEIEPYCQQVLSARQKDGHLPWFPIFDDVQTFDGKPWRGLVDVVAGGFPCQDISSAGKGAGIEGSRSSMWKHMARIIGEVRPKYAFVENSPMLVGRGLSVVLADLAEMGYDAEWGIVGAHHVSAPHRRDRIWILATDSNVCGCNYGGDSERQHEANHAQVGEVTEDQQSGSIGQHWTSEDCGDVANAESGKSRQQTEWERRENTIGGGSDCGGDSESRRDIRHATSEGLSHRINGPLGQPGTITESERSDWWATEPDVGRVAHGVAARVDRLKAIGNGQVPAVAATAWQVLTNRLHEKTIDI